MRLTDKGYVSCNIDEDISCDYCPNASLSECLTKLGQLEDIEDELGIELITLFKALKNCIYIKIVDNLMSEYFKKPIGTILKRQVLNANTIFITTRDLEYLDERKFTFSLKDYGKIWALTKEELK